MTEQDLLSLINLDAFARDVSSVAGLEAARNLERLFLDSNRLTNCTLPSGPAHLPTLVIEFDPLTQLILPPGLTGLTELDLGLNAISLPGSPCLRT